MRREKKGHHYSGPKSGVNWVLSLHKSTSQRFFFPSAHLTKNLPSSILTGTSNTNNNTKPYFMSHIMDTHKTNKVNNLMLLFYFIFINLLIYFYSSSTINWKSSPLSNRPFATVSHTSIKLEYIFTFRSWFLCYSFNTNQSG